MNLDKSKLESKILDAVMSEMDKSDGENVVKPHMIEIEVNISGEEQEMEEMDDDKAKKDLEQVLGSK